ncbi:MAG: tetratricopeptide repeat protein [Desulfosarcina sp.]
MTNSVTAKELFTSGMVEFANARYDKSIELFTQAIDGDHRHALAFVSRGAAYLKMDLFDQAKDDFDSAITIDPDYARAYHMRGLVYEKQGDDRSALADFDRAININPEYGAAYYSRASLHVKLDNTDKAQADIEMVAHLGGKNMENYMNENNVWHTQHMRVENALETELAR